jgi:hypothetical protein
MPPDSVMPAPNLPKKLGSIHLSPLGKMSVGSVHAVASFALYIINRATPMPPTPEWMNIWLRHLQMDEWKMGK